MSYINKDNIRFLRKFIYIHFNILFCKTIILPQSKCIVRPPETAQYESLELNYSLLILFLLFLFNINIY